MRYIRNISIALLALITFSVAANAQAGRMQVNMNYNYSLPLGTFKSGVVNDGSSRGFAGSLQYGISNKWAVGVGVGYQDYYQKYPRALYQLDKTQTISAVLTNSIEVTPLVAKATYMPVGGRGAIQPYISLGAGAGMISYKQYLGSFTYNNKSSVNFVAQGGAGVMIPFGKLSSSGVQLGANYQYVPYNNFGNTQLSSLNFQAGVFFPLR